MQRIKASGVVSVMPPAQENSYDPGYFSNGNPATGELATMLNAEWCNGVQEELIAVISGAGLTPSQANLGQLWEALQKLFTNSDAEKWRKSMIGALFPLACATLPEGFVKPDGSLVLFEDYPEFADAYEDGAFNGMLLEATATDEDKQAWAGKWVKNAQGTGLYTPRLSGLFLRNGETIGKYNQAGVPGFMGGCAIGFPEGQQGTFGHTGIVKPTGYVIGMYGGGSLQDGTAGHSGGIVIDSSLGSDIYGASDTVMTASADMPVGIYLGKTAQI